MNKYQKLICVVSFIIIITVLFVFYALTCYRAGYKDACSDFYNGHLKMDLVENQDGTREWKFIKKNYWKYKNGNF